jgi:hypothetical protein
MKALTLKQPWAWLVVHGPKHIENRRWNTKHRGRFYIHASKTHERNEYFSASRVCEPLGFELPPYVSPLYQCGGIIGSAELVWVLYREDVEDWKFQGQYGFVLANRRPTKFVPCPGALNFWSLREDILSQLHDQ